MSAVMQQNNQQVFRWVYESRITDPEQMTNLSKSFRSELPKSTIGKILRRELREARV